MRILFILHQFYPEFSGGTERVALNLARSAQRAGHYVSVLASTIYPAISGGSPCPDLAGAIQSVYEGVPCVLLPRALLPAVADYSFECDPVLVKSLAAWMVRERFDVVHVLHPMRMASALLAVQRSKLPYMLTLTDFFSACFRINLVNVSKLLCQGPQGGLRCGENCLVTPWTSEALVGRHLQAQGLLAGSGARICPSEYVAARYHEFFPDLEFSVIPHGIDLLAHAASERPSTVPGKDGLTFGFIGAIVPQKGLDTLLRAFIQVPDLTLRLRVIGGFYGDPIYHKEVRNLADADSRVELLGQVSSEQVVDALQSIDVLCLPSRVPETFSLVLHEAAASGVPALVSNLGAPGQLVAQHGGGLVLPLDDVEAWKTAIADLAAHPEHLGIWRAKLPLPLRIEEEAFFYESHYRSLLHPG